MKFIKQMSRSVFKVRYPVKGSFNLGEICPLGAPIEVVPGDGYLLDVYSVIRMATPIAPIMDDIDAEIAAFFVPTRLISHKTYGDITSPYSQNQTTHNAFEKIIGNGVGNPADWTRTNLEAFSAPTEKWLPSHARSAAYTTIGEALGLGLGIANSGDTTAKNVLGYQLYGYNLIYQEHYRNQNVESSRTLDKTSNFYGVSGEYDDTDDDSSINAYNQALSVAYKHGDMFINAVPNPQKGPSVPLPLGTRAPLIGHSPYILKNPDGNTANLFLGNNSTTFNATTTHNLVGYADSQGKDLIAKIDNTAESSSGSFSNINRINLYADLSNATAATVNSFIEAYNIQQLLMSDIKGTRYYEQLKAHYGIENDDIRLYRPEILSVNRFPINISTVVQQSGAAASTSSTDQGNYLGTTGGYSMTAHKDHAVSQDFGEFGYIYLLVVCRQSSRCYGQGIPKQYLRSTRFDWFFPELARIGWQEIDKRRLNAENAANQVFGYEPAWQELRDVNHGQAFGFLNPTKDNSLDYWVLSENYSATPTLSISFLKESRTELARALTIADTGPDFIIDALVVGKKSSLVPVANTPKLFD